MTMHDEIVTYTGTIRGSVGSALEDLETALEDAPVTGTRVVADIKQLQGKYFQAYVVYESG